MTHRCHGEVGSENISFLWLQVVHGSVSFTGLAAVSEPSFGIPTSFPGHVSCVKRTALFASDIMQRFVLIF